MDWGAIGIAFGILTTMCNVIFCILIKFNDFKHLTEDVNILIVKVDKLCERISRMEGVCSICVKEKLE